MNATLWIRALSAVGIVCAVPLIVTMLLARREDWVRRLLPALLAFGVGVLIASACFHLLPESLAEGAPAVVVLSATLGFGLFAGMEWLLEQHDHGHVHGLAMGVPGHEHPPVVAARAGGARSGGATARATATAATRARALVPIAFGADVLHNFLDGILIAAAFLVRPEFGVLTAVAIGVHELPRELGTFGLLVHGGLSPKRAVAFNALTAVFAMAGASLTLLLGSAAEQMAALILPFSAGSMLYIALSVGRSIYPHPPGGRRWPQLGWTGLGLAAVALLLLGGAA